MSKPSMSSPSGAFQRTTSVATSAKSLICELKFVRRCAPLPVVGATQMSFGVRASLKTKASMRPSRERSTPAYAPLLWKTGCGGASLATLTFNNWP
jgi:hypothetical protein